jgi:hypothetical protein
MSHGHGGRRPGAGAPRNTLSRIKTGRYSKQLRDALFSSDPGAWKNYLARIHDPEIRERVALEATLIWFRRRFT